MAAFAHFKASQANGLLLHDGRNENETRERSNESIDPKRTHLNYDLCEKEGTAYQRFKERLSNVKCMKRDDVNVLDSFCVSLPTDVRPEDERKFFEGVYEFYKRDIGEENIVGAFVHKDEKTPHLHFDFIPVVTDTNRKGEQVEKVCHDKKIPRSYLKSMHTRLSNALEEHLGYKVSILNGATVNGNKTVQELKAQEAEKRANRLTERADALTLDDKKGLLESKRNYEERQALYTERKLIEEQKASLEATKRFQDARSVSQNKREKQQDAREKNLDREVEERARGIKDARYEAKCKELDKLYKKLDSEFIINENGESVTMLQELREREQSRKASRYKEKDELLDLTKGGLSR